LCASVTYGRAWHQHCADTPHTLPPRSPLDTAARHGLRVMVGLSAEQSVGYLIDGKLPGDFELRSRGSAAGHPALLCFALGNEIMARRCAGSVPAELLLICNGSTRSSRKRTRKRSERHPLTLSGYLEEPRRAAEGVTDHLPAAAGMSRCSSLQGITRRDHRPSNPHRRQPPIRRPGGSFLGGFRTPAFSARPTRYDGPHPKPSTKPDPRRHRQQCRHMPHFLPFAKPLETRTIGDRSRKPTQGAVEVNYY
jgi:hypothetical protein